jgi:outer membrane biogenesis lipoprotein LolB
MKAALAFAALLLLTACASQNDNPPNPGPTKAEIKARDEFANGLPKPPER